MLSKAESEAGDGAASVSELLAAKFSHRFPRIRVGRPGRFLETVRRIADPITQFAWIYSQVLLEMSMGPHNQKQDVYRCVCHMLIINSIVPCCVVVCFKRNYSVWWLFSFLFCLAKPAIWLVHGTNL